MYFDLRLWQFTRGVRGRILATVAVGVAASALGILRLALLGWLIGRVFQGATLAELALPAAGVAAAMLLRGVLEHARAMMAHTTAARVQRHLRQVLYDKIATLGPAWFGRQRTGAVIATVIDGVEQLETYFGQYLPQLAVATVMPLAVFLGVLLLDFWMAATLLAFALAALLAPQGFHRWDRRNSLRRSKAYKAFAAEFLDSVQGLATLKAFGQSGDRLRSLTERAHELFRSTMWVMATNAASRGIADTAIALGAAATLAVGAWRVEAGLLDLTALLMVLMVGVEAFRPMRDLRALMHQGMVAQASAQAVFELLDGEAPVKATARADALPAEPSVAFEDVQFTYPGGRGPAHRGLDFRVEPGERVGIVGASGSGKSSIVKLLLRLYDPDSGAVRIGGRDLRDMGFDQVRGLLAVVGQDSYLFHGTVEDNLRIGRPDATQEQLEDAARAANAHDFIRRLPQGYRTVVGERGIRLSGGQRQRIAIARALLRDAPILVLDEALSAVDAANEAAIQDALDRLMRGRTTIVCAHRLSSVIGCDRILVLDGGRVAESGSHAELMRAGGVYRRLMAAQAEDASGAAPLLAESAADSAEDVRPGAVDRAELEPADGILRAEGLGWGGAIRALMAHVRPWRAKLAGTFLLGVARVLAFIGVGVAGALAVAAVKRGEPFEPYLWWLFLLAPAAGLLHWLESWMAHDTAFRMLTEMRIQLFAKLDRLAPAYLLRRRTGDLVGMATADVETVEYFFAHTIAPAFVAVLIPAAVLAVLGWSGWPMAAALLPFLLAVAVSPFLLRGRIDRLAGRAREALGDLNAHAADTVQGLAEIAAFGHEARRGAEFMARIDRHQGLRQPFYRDLTLQHAVLEAATGLGGLAVVLSGAALAQAGRLDPALLPLMSILAMAAFLPVSEIAQIGRQLADTLGATRRLHAVHAEPPAVTDGPGVAAPAARGGAALALEDVRYRYRGTPEDALKGVGFAVPAGATVALVGPSGAGKTTVAHMLLRFWDPDSGRVTMDGRDLRDWRLDDLRRRVALVAQDTYLFNDTLEANIRIARPDASDAALRQAMERAALADFVDGLPEGLATPVGERGMQLSGGQRQRVAIARAFLKDAPVLILDEATSHLDAVSEALVRRALDDLMADRTTVVIAHRLSTVRDADLIVAMADGRAVEAGTHAELLARGGLYAALVARQMGAAAAD